MQLGLVFPQTEIPDDPNVILKYVQAVESAGFDYLLAFDHVVGVNPRARPNWKGFEIFRKEASKSVHGQSTVVDNGQLKKRAVYDYSSRFHEPMVLYAFLSAVTSKLQLATGVVILPQRQTALLAKQAANVANMSQGRLRLGVGIGWNDAEYDALGMNFKTRGRRCEEQIQLLRRLWEEDTVSFEGVYDRIEGVGINPRPHQSIPLWVGGNSETAMDRAARLGDGWQPRLPVSKARERAESFREKVDKANRDQAVVGLENLIHCGATVGGPVLSVEEAADQALQFRAAGFTHICINTMNSGHSCMEEHLDFAQAWLQLLRQN